MRNNILKQLSYFLVYVLIIFNFIPNLVYASDAPQAINAKTDITSDLYVASKNAIFSGDIEKYELIQNELCEKHEMCNDIETFYGSAKEIGLDEKLYLKNRIEIKINELKKCGLKFEERCLSKFSYQSNEPLNIRELLYNPYAKSTGVDSIYFSLTEQIKKKCVEGKTDYCTTLADHYTKSYAKGRSLVKKLYDAEKASELYKIACNQGLPIGCLEYAGLFRGQLLPVNYKLNQDYVGIAEKLKSQKLVVYEAKCINNQYNACKEAADVVIFLPGKNNKTRGLQLYERACSNYVQEACEALRNFYLSGYTFDDYNLEQNTNKALAYFEKACSSELHNGGEIRYCYEELKDGYIKGEIGEVKFDKNLAKAEEIIKQTLCQPKLSEKCSEYAKFLMENKSDKASEVLSILKNSCEENDQYDCIALATYNENNLGNNNPSNYFEIYQKACNEDIPIACYKIASFHENGEVTEKNLKKAFNLYQYACLNSVEQACFKLGQFYELGLGVEKDLKKSKDILSNLSRISTITSSQSGFFGRLTTNIFFPEADNKFLLENSMNIEIEACKNSDTFSCYKLSELAVGDEKIDKTYSDIKRFEKYCESKIFEACEDVGNAYLHGKGVIADSIIAIQNYKIACDNNISTACTSLGTIYLDGEKISRNYEEAFKFLYKSCELKVSIACYFVGEMYQDGLGRPTNLVTAIKYYSKSCNSDEVDDLNCEKIGSIYLSGKLGKKDTVSALKYFKMGCDSNRYGNDIGNSCLQLALVLTDKPDTKNKFIGYKILESFCGIDTERYFTCSMPADAYRVGKFGFVQDIDKALELYNYGCDNGSALSCNELGIIYVQGKDIDEDRDKAEKYFKKACTLKSIEGCENYKRISE